MDLSLTRSALVELAEAAASCADPKGAMPVLKMAKFDVREQDAIVTATNTQRTVEARVRADVSKPGAVLVDARRLLKCAKALPASGVRITTTDLSMVLASERRKFVIATQPVEDFPGSVAWPSQAREWTAPSATIAALTKRVRHAISADSTRPHLNALVLEEHDGRLRAAATDGHRLAIAYSTDKWDAQRTLIPAESVALLLSLCERGDLLAFGSTSETSVYVRCGDRGARLAVYEASPPPVDQVVPKAHQHVLEVSRAALKAAVAAVSHAANRVGSVLLDVKSGRIRISAESADDIGAHDEVDAEGGPAEALGIGVNATYLLDALGAFDGESITMGIGGELDPIVIRDAEIESDLAVVMPVRL